MTALEIAKALASRERTPLRDRKAKVLAETSKVPWADVEAALIQLPAQPPIRTTTQRTRMVKVR